MGQANSIVKHCNNTETPLNRSGCVIRFDTSGIETGGFSTTVLNASSSNMAVFNTSTFSDFLVDTSSLNASAVRVKSFGSVIREGFEGDADIAGKGVFFAFVTVSVVIVTLSLVITAARGFSILANRFGSSWAWLAKTKEWPDKLHDVLDTLIISSADVQLLLIVALAVAFLKTSQCSISLYHYLIMYHMTLLGVATSVLALVLVCNPAEFLISSSVRLGFIWFCIGNMMATRRKDASLYPQLAAEEIQDKIPSKGQQDSLLFLPAYCILEESFNMFLDLPDDQSEYLTNKGDRRFIVVQNIVVAATATIVSCLILIILVYKCICLYLGRKVPLNTWMRIWSYTRIPIKGLVWFTSLGVIVWNWVIIVQLRHWIDQSEWLDKKSGNPENVIRGIGQIAPLASLGAIGFALLDMPGQMWRRRKARNRNSNKSVGGSSIQSQSLTPTP
ncbi:hypothetical protein B0O99DRAFT_694198 [Bisporella sp. PMI_857]|nr:hypothetical protein B0O99DRAFT_694198 [Bisporella sp. PMI_857]